MAQSLNKMVDHLTLSQAGQPQSGLLDPVKVQRSQLSTSFLLLPLHSAHNTADTSVTMPQQCPSNACSLCCSNNPSLFAHLCRILLEKVKSSKSHSKSVKICCLCMSVAQPLHNETSVSLMMVCASEVGMSVNIVQMQAMYCMCVSMKLYPLRPSVVFCMIW